MRKDCDGFQEGLVALAHGEEAPAAKSHLLTCEDCQGRLQDLIKLVAALRFPILPPPMAVSARAKAIMPAAPRPSVRVAWQTASAFRGEGGRAAILEKDQVSGRILVQKDGRKIRIEGLLVGALDIETSSGAQVPIGSDGHFTAELAEGDQLEIQGPNGWFSVLLDEAE